MEEFTPTQEAAAPGSKITPKEVINWGLIIIGGFLIYKIFRGTGLIKSVSEQKQQEIEDKIENEIRNADYTGITKYTDPKFWVKSNTPAGYESIIYSPRDAAKWCIQMYSMRKAFGDDDEEGMLALIKDIQYQTQYSYLVYAFSLLYKTDLTAWLKNYFSGDFDKVIAHISSRPAFKKK